MSLMVSVAPPGRKLYIPEAQETVEEATTRYEDIARDTAYVVWDPLEKPIFRGSRGRIRTTLVLYAVISYESAFRKDVDTGEGPMSKGDGGKSWCLNQVNLGKKDGLGNTPYRIVVNIGGGYKFTTKPDEGWSGQDLVDDRQKCLHAALAVLRSSFSACSALPIESRLDQYASGHCDRGEEASQRRMGLALLWMSRKMPSFKDDDVMGWLEEDKRPTELSPETQLVVSKNDILDLTSPPPMVGVFKPNRY